MPRPVEQTAARPPGVRRTPRTKTKKRRQRKGKREKEQKRKTRYDTIPSAIGKEKRQDTDTQEHTRRTSHHDGNHTTKQHHIKGRDRFSLQKTGFRGRIAARHDSGGYHVRDRRIRRHRQKHRRPHARPRARLRPAAHRARRRQPRTAVPTRLAERPRFEGVGIRVRRRIAVRARPTPGHGRHVRAARRTRRPAFQGHDPRLPGSGHRTAGHVRHDRRGRGPCRRAPVGRSRFVRGRRHAAHGRDGRGAHPVQDRPVRLADGRRARRIGRDPPAGPDPRGGGRASRREAVAGPPLAGIARRARRIRGRGRVG